MLSTQKMVTELINENGFLQFGFQHGLLNLSQLARFLKPLIEVRVKKNLSESSVLMALSRAMKQRHPFINPVNVALSNIFVTNHIAELSYPKTERNLKKLIGLYQELAGQKGFYCVNQSITELSILFENSLTKIIKKHMGNHPIFEKSKLTLIGTKFDPKYILDVSFVYLLIQQITLQNINIIEFNSTYTELNFFVAQKDAKLAFDTLYSRFA